MCLFLMWALFLVGSREKNVIIASSWWCHKDKYVTRKQSSALIIIDAERLYIIDYTIMYRRRQGWFQHSLPLTLLPHLFGLLSGQVSIPIKLFLILSISSWVLGHHSSSNPTWCTRRPRSLNRFAARLFRTMSSTYDTVMEDMDFRQKCIPKSRTLFLCCTYKLYFYLEIFSTFSEFFFLEFIFILFFGLTKNEKKIK